MILLKNNYYEEKDQRLFSTGDSELDDILEEVYYSGLEDGYEYAQREFGKKEATKEVVDYTEKLIKKATGPNYAKNRVYIKQLPKSQRRILVKGNGHGPLIRDGKYIDTEDLMKRSLGRAW